MGESLEERVARVSGRADRPPAPAWTPDKPEAGHPQAIAGEVVEISDKPGAGFKGETITAVTVRTVDGIEWSVWCFGKILGEQLAPAPRGAVVAIAYLGRKEGKKQTYREYRVVVETGELPSGSAPLTPRPPAPAVATPEPDPIEPPPATSTSSQACEACGFAGGKHAAGCPSKPEPVVCSCCGFLDGHHRDGCDQDIPF